MAHTMFDGAAVGGQKCRSLRKMVRLRRRAAGVESPAQCHPTKKATAGRKRHFEEQKRKDEAAENYRHLLQGLYIAAQQQFGFALYGEQQRRTGRAGK